MGSKAGQLKESDQAYEYEYESLADSEIRLLSLAPGANEDPLRCKLEKVSLQEAADTFDAVSYVWGDPSRVSHVSCGGFDLRITKNLHEVLKRMRLVDRARKLWVDAICIHQGAPEHSQQVQLMGEIYSSARRVLVWLGPASEGCKEAFEELPRWLRQTPPRVDWTIARLEWSGRTSFRFDSAGLDEEATAWLRSQQKTFPPIADIFSRAWWYRKWTVQEVVRAKTATFLCGSYSLDWGDIRMSLAEQELQNVFYYLMGFGSDEKTARDRKNCYENPPNYGFYNAKRLATMAIGYASDDPSTLSSLRLDNLIWNMKDFRCSDPRDHVYGLLGIVKDVDPSYKSLIDADYTVNVATTSVRLHEYFMYTDPRPLSHFRKVTGQRNEFNGSLISSNQQDITPSWASSYLDPDFTSRGDLQYHLLDHEFRAGIGSKESKVVWDREPNMVLSVKGIVLGQIEEILGSPLYTGSLYEPGAVGWARRVWSAVTSRVSDPTKQLDTFSDLVTCGHVRSGTRNGGILKPEREVMRAWLDLHLDERHGELDTPRLTDNDLWFVNRLMDRARYRQLCVTSRGSLGWVPQSCRAGDEFCVFLGETSMFVIGPCGGGRYNLIGECFMQGLMFGEAMGLDLPEQRINLY